MRNMKLGSVTTLVIVVISVFLVLGLFFFLTRGNEDDWIKDSKGIYIKHGNPSTNPGYVLEQQDALSCSTDLYNQTKTNAIAFNSQCLGACNNYSVDIVHVPRNMEDDKPANQCSDYPKKTPYFIELDSNGNVVRVA
jgi:hypothetical protein